MTNLFSLLFLVAFSLTLLTRLWLGWRQIRHVLQHRPQVPPDFAERISLAAHQKAADYTVDRGKFALFNILIEALLLLFLTLGGGLAWLHELWTTQLDASADTLSYGLAMIFSLMALSALIDLPLALYRQFVIEARHGFNRMTMGLFFADLGKQTLLGGAIGAPVILAVLWLMDHMGEMGWLYVWGFWSAFNLLILFIYPTWIAPLFNRFTPLEDGELKTRIESLLSRCGFHSQGLFVMDGSKRSSHGNAYFTGFGDNKRIVFFDTLIQRLTPAEIDAVLAHELGHYRCHHIRQRIVMMFALSFVLLFILGQLLHSPAFFQGLGVPVANNALALILFFLVLPVFTFPLTPVGSYFSRRHEFEADAYAVAHTGRDDLGRALVKLYEDNAATLTPDPLHSLFYDSHPPAALRIAHLHQTGAA